MIDSKKTENEDKRFVDVGTTETGGVRLPKAVYYQCIWIIKDMPRLEKLARRMVYEDEAGESVMVLYTDNYVGILRDEVMIEARHKLDCIKAALDKIPSEYRNNILNNIIDMQAFGTEAHPNTWKKWKHIFISNLARNLGLY